MGKEINKVNVHQDDNMIEQEEEVGVTESSEPTRVEDPNNSEGTSKEKEELVEKGKDDGLATLDTSSSSVTTTETTIETDSLSKDKDQQQLLLLPPEQQQPSIPSSYYSPPSLNVVSDFPMPEPMPLPDLQRHSVAHGQHRRRPGAESRPGAFAITTFRASSNNDRQPPHPPQTPVAAVNDEEQIVCTSDVELVTDDQDQDNNNNEDPEVALSSSEVIMGRTMNDDNENGKPRRRIGWAILSCFAVLGILALVLVAVVPSNDNSKTNSDDNDNVENQDLLLSEAEGDSGNSEDSTLAPTTFAPAAEEELEVYPVFWNDSTYFHPSVVNTIMDANPNNAWYLANVWMINDPYLANYTREQHMQRFFMAAFYYMFNGDYWYHNDGWLTYDLHGECNWYMHIPSQEDQELYRYNFTGHCDDDYNLIVFDMKDNNVTGVGQEAFIVLSWVQYYDISYNHISGRPIRTPYMPRAQIGVVSHNDITGFMSSEGNMGPQTNVRVMRMDGNNFMGGNDPSWWQWFPNIEIYNITGNQFSAQALSSAVQYSPKLRYIGVADNLNFGTIPSEVGLLSNLRVLDISGNIDVLGSVPTEIGVLNNFVLNIEGTSINGSIPEIICQRRDNDNDDASLEIIANCSEVECCSDE